MYVLYRLDTRRVFVDIKQLHRFVLKIILDLINSDGRTQLFTFWKLLKVLTYDRMLAHCKQWCHYKLELACLKLLSIPI